VKEEDFMVRKRSTVLLVVTLALAVVVGMAKDKNGLAFKPPDGWKLGYSASVREGTILELVKDGDTVEDWKELITVQNLVKPKGIRNLDEFFSGIKAGREKDCPGVTTWHVIDQSEGAMTYEWSTSSPCLGQPVQTELAKILWSKKDFWMFHYARKVNELSKDDEELWLRWLSELRLTGAD
jgi:hypothetical protein